MSFDRIKLDKRLELLERGRVLYIQHIVYGTYKVYMNTQRNRILREGVCRTAKKRCDYNNYTVNTTFNGELNGCIMDPQRGTSEESIGHLLLWNCGRWFLQGDELYDGMLKLREV